MNGGPGGLQEQRGVQNRQVRRRVCDRIEATFGNLEDLNAGIDMNRGVRRCDAHQMQSRGQKMAEIVWPQMNTGSTCLNFHRQINYWLNTFAKKSHA